MLEPSEFASQSPQRVFPCGDPGPRSNTSVEPSAEKFAFDPSSMIRRAAPPSGDTDQMPWPARSNMTWSPLGDQRGRRLGALPDVICSGSPDRIGFTNTWVTPSTAIRKAIICPSGDSEGLVWLPSNVESRSSPRSPEAFDVCQAT